MFLVPEGSAFRQSSGDIPGSAAEGEQPAPLEAGLCGGCGGTGTCTTRTQCTTAMLTAFSGALLRPGCFAMSSAETLMEDWRPVRSRSSSSSSPSQVAKRAERSQMGGWSESLDVNFYADTSMTIPGYGDPGAGCGEWAPREFCDHCGEVHLGPHRCHQRDCPDCWSSWSARRAEGITRRLQSARWSLEDGIERRAVHVMASPPEGSVQSLADVKRYRKRAIEKAKESGVRGGVTVFHGFRTTEETDRRYEAEDPECGKWEWIREHQEDWRTFVYWSPHYHIIGLATEVEPPSSEWVVSRLSTLDPMKNLSRKDSYESVAKTAQYLLSHATYESSDDGKGVKSVTWYGDLHPSNFTPDPTDVDSRKTEPKLDAPSHGAYKVIQRVSAEVTRSDGKEKRDGGGRPDCENEDCNGDLQEIWDAGRLLADVKFCDRLDKDVERRLRTAFEWAVGDRRPPPGLKRPRSREDATEALEALL